MSKFGFYFLKKQNSLSYRKRWWLAFCTFSYKWIYVSTVFCKWIALFSSIYKEIDNINYNTLTSYFYDLWKDWFFLFFL